MKLIIIKFTLFSIIIFSFLVDASSSITLSINSKKTITFNKLIMGANCNFTTRVYGPDNKEVQELTKFGGLTLLRYPGGAVGNFWNWRTGRFLDFNTLPEYVTGTRGYMEKKLTDRNAKIDTYQDGAITVDEFVEFCSFTGSEPIWMLNLYTGSIGMTSGWVKYCVDKGYSTKYWELGNEAYLKHQKAKYQRNVFIYIKEAKEHAKILKKLAPNAKVSVVGVERAIVPSNPGEKVQVDDDWVYTTTDSSWNDGLAKYDFYDAVVLHDYFTVDCNPQKIFSGDKYHRYLMARIPAELPFIVSNFRRTFKGGKKLWITEWNIREKDRGGKLRKGVGDKGYGNKKGSKSTKKSVDQRYWIGRTLSHSLYVADWILTALKHPDIIELSTYHVLAESGLKGLFQKPAPERKNADKPFLTDMKLHVFAFFKNIHQAADRVIIPEVDGCKTLRGTLKFRSTEYPAVNTLAFSKDGEIKRIAVINKDKEPVKLDIRIDGKKLERGLSAEILTADQIVEDFGKDKGVQKIGYWFPQYEIIKKKYKAGKDLVLPGYCFAILIFD